MNFESLIELNSDGYWWRKSDTSYKFISRETAGPAFFAADCASKKVVIQAGGHCGLITSLYSKIFETVYTFEPDPVNFYCLTKNCQTENVIKFQSCLGNNKNFVSLDFNAKTNNSASKHVGKKPGTIPTLLIDDLGLEVCDLIHLDLEGYELFAIQGAVKTIARCSPTIVLEMHSQVERYGASEIELEKLMSKLNYQKHKTFGNDVVFKTSTPL